MAQIKLQLVKPETIRVVIEPFNREPSSTKQLKPVNQIGQSSSQSETFVQPTGAFLYQHICNQQIYCLQFHQFNLHCSTNISISILPYIDRNQRLPTKFNAGQFLQQLPIYTPSNFGAFNVTINLHLFILALYLLYVD